MNPLQLLTLTILLHLVADYNLQGILASMKQKQWWDDQLKNASEEDKKEYKHDFLVALWEHSFMWSAITFAPILWLSGDKITTWLIFGANVLIHGMTDNAKANWKCINLLQDQMLHIGQIMLTVLAFYAKVCE